MGIKMEMPDRKSYSAPQLESLDIRSTRDPIVIDFGVMGQIVLFS